MPALADLLRWGARLLSIGAALFVLALAIGEGVPRPGSLGFRVGAYFLLMLVGLGANLAAWRWDVQGASTALVALALLAAVEITASGRLPGAWFFILLGIPACAHLLAWALRLQLGAAP